MGPSAESDVAVVNVGEAAHITAAASGTSARRYDPSLTPEERAAIGNAIWLCAYHARLIDRDETTFTADELREMKNRHEEGRKRALLNPGSPSTNDDGDLIALGNDIVVVGSLISGSNAAWEIQFREFLDGSLDRLAHFCEGFKGGSSSDDYVVVNELGDGRRLSAPATWHRDSPGFRVTCPIAPRFARSRAQDTGEDLKIGPDHDLDLSLGTVSGVDAFRQRVMTCLSAARGEWFLDRGSGSRLAEYHALFSGSPWFDRLTKLEVTRLAAISQFDSLHKDEYLPLLCVEKVRGFQFQGAPRLHEWNKVAVDFDVNGLGKWTEELEIYLPSVPTGEDPLDPKRIARMVNQLALKGD